MQAGNRYFDLSVIASLTGLRVFHSIHSNNRLCLLKN